MENEEKNLWFFMSFSFTHVCTVYTKNVCLSVCPTFGLLNTL